MMQGESKHPAKKCEGTLKSASPVWSLRLVLQPITEMVPVFGTVGMVGTGVASQLTQPQLCHGLQWKGSRHAW